MIREDFWLPWDLRGFLYLSNIFIDNITVVEKGLSQNIFPNKCFSNRQLISNQDIFFAPQLFTPKVSNREIFFKSTKKSKKTVFFQIYKKSSNRWVFFKSTKKLKIHKPFQIHKIMRSRQIFLKPQKNRNRLHFFNLFTRVILKIATRTRLCKHNTK